MTTMRLTGRLVASVAAGAVLVAFGLAGLAGADSPSDPRATFHGGNATTCAEVGATGTILFVDGANNGSDANLSGTVSNGGTRLNLTELNPVTIHAIVVKGGNGYNVYSSNVSDMISPLNNGGNIPTISHWFVCYDVGAPVTTTTTTTTTGSGTGTGGTSTSGAAGQAGAATVIVTQPQFTG